MAKKNVLWPIGPHTPGKHLVLRSYLNAWLPIMAFSNERVVFIDGFAGPGVYESGELGSPVIAVNALVEHHAKKGFKEVRYLFIESDEERAHHLRSVIDSLRSKLPPNCQVDVHTGACDETLNRLLDGLESKKNQLAPAFIMLDPFGISGIPLTTIARVLKNPKAEIYISFMYEWINRFKTTDEFSEPLDELYGTMEWRKAFAIEDPEARKDFLLSLYEDQLRSAGAKYVTSFELYHGDRLKYAIFFATKHRLGLDRMKAAIWNMDRSGGYAFRGGHSKDQMTFDLAEEVNVGPLADAMIEAFGNDDWVLIDEIVDWAMTDATYFHSGHVKKALRVLENRGLLHVDPKSRKKRNTYPEGTRIRFSGELE